MLTYRRLVGTAVLIAAAAVPASAQVRSVTVGIDTTCPYGLVAWWPAVLEGLQRLDGVKKVEERLDPIALTASIATAKEALPNAVTIEKCLKRTGEQFSLRGIEVTAEGVLVTSGDRRQLLLPGEKPLTLTPLTTKVQWDTKKKERAALSESETAAFRRLNDAAPSHKERIRITGPLRRSEKGELTLEVRDFSWILVRTSNSEKWELDSSLPLACSRWQCRSSPSPKLRPSSASSATPAKAGGAWKRPTPASAT
jgi:hypothetical protein